MYLLDEKVVVYIYFNLVGVGQLLHGTQYISSTYNLSEKEMFKVKVHNFSIVRKDGNIYSVLILLTYMVYHGN